MTPHFFGPLETRLFGVRHAPENGASTGTRRVLLCYPLGQEYIRIHRTFRLLAARLAKQGFEVLRFDYFATGDSAGDSRQASLAQWLEDIRSAIRELDNGSGNAAYHLVGLRLGASLAALAAAARNDVQSVVLWEPVVDGGAYLARHGVGTDVTPVSLSSPTAGGPADCPEVAGFPLGDTLGCDLEQLDLLTLNRAPAARVCIIEDPGGAQGAQLCDHWRSAGTVLDHQRIAGSQVWDDPVEFGQGHIPYPVLSCIENWLANA